MQTHLHNAAHVRSGGKDGTACIPVIALSPGLYEVVRAQVSAVRSKDFYKGGIAGAVTRCEMPGLEALQFVAEGALGGGASRSLCPDNNGEAPCLAIVAHPIQGRDCLQNQLRGL